MELFYYNCCGGYRAFHVGHDSELYAQKYEVYLCERAVEVLRQYVNYLQEIELNADQRPLTDHQLEALDKYREMIGKKENLDKDNLQYNKEHVKKLTLRLERDSRAANVNVIQIIWTVIGILTILTAATLYIVS